MKQSTLLREIQLFLTKYCQQERRLSRQTVLSYRDTMKLLLNFFNKIKKESLNTLGMADVTYELIVEFLNFLEKKRNSSISTRNQRLCAIKSFLKFVLFRHPDYAETISRAMQVPRKKKSKVPRAYLEPEEVKVLLSSIGQRTWTEKRDRLLIDFCIRTGVRVSELVSIQIENVILGKAPYIKVTGKGRKERSIPIDKGIARSISKWVSENQFDTPSYLFPSTRGNRLSTDAVQHLLKKYVEISKKKSASLALKTVSPHTLRHTTAMNMLNSGVDIQIIALWLGHEQIETTQIYLSESMALKRTALQKTEIDINIPIKKISKTVLDFLDDI